MKVAHKPIALRPISAIVARGCGGGARFVFTRTSAPVPIM